MEKQNLTSLENPTGSKHSKLKAYVGMALSTLIIGLSFVFVKIALQVSHPVDLLAHRFNVAVLAMLFAGGLGYLKIPRYTREESKRLLSVSVFYPLLFFGLQAVGMRYTTASEAGILSAITPVFTLILASVILKERSSFSQVIGVLVSIAGVLYIFHQSGTTLQGESLKGNGLILLSVLSIVFYYIAGKKVNHRYRTIDITFFMLILAAVVFNVFALGYHLIQGEWASYLSPLLSMRFVYAVFYLGILSSLLTSIFNNYALSHLSASNVAVINNLTPVISVVGGILILREQLHVYHYIGAVLVILGVLVTSLFPLKK